MPTYPVSPPTVSGTELTVDIYSKNPTIIARTIMAMRQNDYWLGDLVFRGGPTAESGSVVYYPVTSIDDQFLNTATDIEAVGPGGEFPVVSYSNIAPSTALTQKYGAKMKTTKEMKTRNQIGKYRSGIQAIYNNAKRKADTRAVAALNAASITSQSETAAWSTVGTDIVYDLLVARNTIENSQLGKTEGYQAQDVVLGSTQWFNLLKNTSVRSILYNAGMFKDAQNLLSMRSLDGFLGFRRFRMNPFITATDRWVFDGDRAGEEITEYPLTLEHWYEERIQSDWDQLSQSNVYIVEAPKSVVKIV